MGNTIRKQKINKKINPAHEKVKKMLNDAKENERLKKLREDETGFPYHWLSDRLPDQFIRKQAMLNEFRIKHGIRVTMTKASFSFDRQICFDKGSKEKITFKLQINNNILEKVLSITETKINDFCIHGNDIQILGTEFSFVKSVSFDKGTREKISILLKIIDNDLSEILSIKTEPI
jgi:hypothetical protein